MKMNKKSFYCWYLGFNETYGLQSQTRFQELIKNFLANQIKQKGSVAPSKVTVRLSDSNMMLLDSSAPLKKNTSRKSNTKAYVISYDKISHVSRVASNPDLFTIIVRSDLFEMGPSNSRKSLFYLHVFRFDSEESAKKMELYLNHFRKIFFKKLEILQQSNQITDSKVSYYNNNKSNYTRYSPSSQTEHLANSNLKQSFLKRQIDRITHFQKKPGENLNAVPQSHNDFSFISPVNSNNSLNFFNPPSSHSTRSRTTSPPNMQNINNEIIQKINKGEPLLYPPKDYTHTLVKHGNLPDASKRRSRNPLIVGKEGLKMRDFNELNLELNDSYSADDQQQEDLDNILDEELVLNLLDEAVEENEPSVHGYNSESLMSSVSNNHNLQNLLQSIEEEKTYNHYEETRRNLKAAKENKKPKSVESPFRKKLLNFSNSKSVSTPSEYNTVSAASVGIRSNILTKLGNFKPKIIENNNASLEKQQRLLHENASNYRANKALNKEKNNINTRNNYSNTEFFLRPSEFKVTNDDNHDNQYNMHRNYAREQDSSNHSSNYKKYNPSNVFGAILNTTPSSNLNKKANYKNLNNEKNNPMNVYELNRRYDYNEENKNYFNDIYY